MKKSIKGIIYALVIAAIIFPLMSSAAGFGFSVGGGGFSIGLGTGNAGGAYGSSGASGAGWSLGNVSGFGLPAGSIFGIINNLVLWILAIFGFIGIIGFVIAGIIYILAAGNDTMIEKAKTAMMWSIVGVVVGLVGVVAIQAIDFALRGFGGF